MYGTHDHCVILQKRFEHLQSLVSKRALKPIPPGPKDNWPLTLITQKEEDTQEFSVVRQGMETFMMAEFLG